MSPNLIGLTGRAGTGKDTIAGELTKLAGYQRVAFADPMKAAAYAADPVVDGTDDLIRGGFRTIRLAQLVDLVGWDRAKRFPDVRRFLQRFGTGLRGCAPTLWLDLAANTIVPNLAEGRPVVVTDVRFANEVVLIRGLGGIVARLSRALAPNLGENAGHISERTDDLDVDVDVRNDGPAAHLAAWLDAWATDNRKGIA